jgi:hypothetical protein
MNGSQQPVKFCKVFVHLCKASVEALIVSVEDMFKIKNGEDALHACSSLVIMTEGAASPSIANVTAKSVT